MQFTVSTLSQLVMVLVVAVYEVSRYRRIQDEMKAALPLSDRDKLLCERLYTIWNSSKQDYYETAIEKDDTQLFYKEVSRVFPALSETWHELSLSEKAMAYRRSTRFGDSRWRDFLELNYLSQLQESELLQLFRFFVPESVLPTLTKVQFVDFDNWEPYDHIHRAKIREFLNKKGTKDWNSEFNIMQDFLEVRYQIQRRLQAIGVEFLKQTIQEYESNFVALKMEN